MHRNSSFCTLAKTNSQQQRFSRNFNSTHFQIKSCFETQQLLRRRRQTCFDEAQVNDLTSSWLDGGNHFQFWGLKLWIDDLSRLEPHGINGG